MGALTFALLAASLSATSAFDPDRLPNELSDWQDWVRHDVEYLQCPIALGGAPGDRNAHLCAWPGRLDLSTDSAGARFEIRWRVYDEGWIPLPTGPRSWPLEVRMDDAPAVVVDRGGPEVFVGPGEHRLAGRLRWDQRPQFLRIPDAVGLVGLSVDGEVVENPTREDGRLWLGERRAPEGPETASAEVSVQRLLADGIPLRLTTRVDLTVAGEAREEVLGQPIPEGFEPTALSSPLPLRLDEERRLVAQVRPGRWTLEIESRALRLPVELSPPHPQGLWPTEEVWSFAADPRLRVAVVEGVPAIDPTQAGVIGPWSGLPSYLVTPADTVRIVERTRGMAADEVNRLNLQRQVWLDFDHAGYTLLDRLGGHMRQGWRLELSEPVDMTSAEADQSLLVTRVDDGRPGIELRDPQVDLTIGGRIEGFQTSLPAGGYGQSLEQVETTLNLPPGHRLIAALDADRSPGTWVNRWTLLDLFLVLVTAAVFWRVISPLTGLMAGAYLLLAYHEPDAPAWTLLVLAGCAGVIPLLSGWPQRLLKGARNLALLVLAVIAVPFIADQLRLALYPQLDPQGYGRGAGLSDFGAPVAMESPAPQPAPATSAPARAKTEEDLAIMDQVESFGSAARQVPRKYSRYEPGAVVQTGYGRPDWRWNTYRLSWSGPVLPEQTVRLVIAPPWLVALLRVVLVALLAALAIRLLAVMFPRRRWGGFLAGTVVALALPWGVAAQSTPDPELLDELRARLLEPPPCGHQCGTVEQTRVVVEEERLVVEQTIHAAHLIAQPLPRADEAWFWESVELDGASVQWVRRDPDGLRRVQLTPGVHRLRIAGVLLAGDGFSLAFPAPPRDVEVSVTGWEMSGLVNRMVPGGGLGFVRLRADGDDGVEFSAQPLNVPEFVTLERELTLDLEWSIVNRVRRVAPAEGSMTVAVPLWPGETVTSADFSVSEGQVIVPFSPGASEVRFVSRIDKVDSMVLQAADLDHLAESWRIVPGPIWHIEATGIPASMPAGAHSDFWTWDYYPRRGEELALAITRPEAVSGHSVAVDRAQLEVDAGRRAQDSRLTLQVRASRGDQHVIEIPPQARVQEVTVNGSQPYNLRAENGRVTVPLSPGEQQVMVAWQESLDMGLVSRSSEVDLGARSSNLSIRISLPGDRWVLFAGGPRVGPAVLYWGELLVMLLVAWALGRTTQTPLKFHHWLLLGLGFSTVSWLALLALIGWLFAMAWRKERRAEGPRWRFNAVQLALVALTLAALGILVSAIPFGLLGRPDMHVVGNGSYGNSLQWFADRSDGVLPVASAVSVPLWWYKAAMLAWALWLSSALLRWLPWTWQCLSADRFWMGKVALADRAESKPEEPES